MKSVIKTYYANKTLHNYSRFLHWKTAVFGHNKITISAMKNEGLNALFRFISDFLRLIIKIETYSCGKIKKIKDENKILKN